MTEVRVGDTVLVKPGQSIPVDGRVLKGVSAVDASALTGESIPVEVQPGDAVSAATLNKSGHLTLEATRVGDDTSLARIIRLVEDAASSKAPIAQLADRVSAIFVPVVLSIAALSTVVWLLLGYSWGFALSIGISVLVISCPCALGLATPTAIMVGTGKGAEYGILFKSAESLETAHRIQTVVMDKTGTVTEGHPSVTDLAPAQGVTEAELIALAAAMEQASEHPLAEAIVQRAQAEGVATPEAEAFQALPGRGLRCRLEGIDCAAGNPALMQELGIGLGSLAQRGADWASTGKTPLYFAQGGCLLGAIAVADTVKADSAEAIQTLQRMGLDVVLLTGDNERTAQAIGREVGVTRVVAQVLPQDKEREIRRLQGQGKVVAMVGDGINDAPALARADVGIAIGAGTDVAIESADLVLMHSSLKDVATAIQLSQAVLRNIKQNLFWAFFYNAIGIPLAAGAFFTLLGWTLNPMIGAAAMSLSSVCVVSNALRLRGFRPRLHHTEPSDTKGETTMKKTLHIEGMMCAHCVAHVGKALNDLPGVTAQVSLEGKAATVTLAEPISDEVLRQAVVDAGYEVTSIE